MNVGEKEQAAAWLWYLRREGEEAGPFSSRVVRRLVLTERLQLNDQVSNDRRDWRFVRDVPEVVPPEKRTGVPFVPAGIDAPNGRFGYSRVSIYLGFAAFLVLVGFGFWQGTGPVGKDPDCTAPPAPGVDWRYCRLERLSIPGANLREADLNSAIMGGSNLSGVDLSGSKLDYADLRGSDLSYASMRGASLKGADLRAADLTYVDLSASDLSFSDLTGATPGGILLAGANTENAIWFDGSKCATGSRGGCLREKAPPIPVE